MGLKSTKIILVQGNVRRLCSRNQAMSTSSKIHSVAKLSIKGSTFHTFVHPPTTITVGALMSVGNYFNILGKYCDFFFRFSGPQIESRGSLELLFDHFAGLGIFL